eukprot:m.475285 g.475285  ORF g.475285 m.475285 type:complete len:147 (+) comp38050_c0_seq1:354-794(+)
MLILKQAEAGRVRLDDPFAPMANRFLGKITAGALDLGQLYDSRIFNVSIRQLLQMSSGLTEYDDEAVRLFQNTHRSDDLTPGWILNTTNRSFSCDPGTCGQYSSTNFVLLGLVLGDLTGVGGWDQVDQRAWVPTDPARAAYFDGLG